MIFDIHLLRQSDTNLIPPIHMGVQSDGFVLLKNKFNLNLFLLRALFFLFFFTLSDFITYVYIYTRYNFQELQDTQNLILFIGYRFNEKKKIILYTCKKSTQWYQIKSFCIINISRNIIHFQINVLSKMYNKQTSAVLIKWYCWI